MTKLAKSIRVTSAKDSLGDVPFAAYAATLREMLADEYPDAEVEIAESDASAVYVYRDVGDSERESEMIEIIENVSDRCADAYAEAIKRLNGASAHD
jgi:hypothetical protein